MVTCTSTNIIRFASGLAQQAHITTAALSMASRVQESMALLAEVMAYAHPELVARLQRKLSLIAAEARALFDDVKRFLFLCGITLSASKIDDGWHEFLLYTMDYISFTKRYFGHSCNTARTRYFPSTR